MAYIFDFDGVLVGTMEAHFQCYKKAMDESGVSIDKKQFYSQAGMKGVEQIQYFANKQGKKVDAQKIYLRKKEIWEVSDLEVTPISCNIKLLKLLKDSGHPVAIASGSSPSSINPIVEKFNIQVDCIITSEDVKRGKPNPDLFLKAAEKLNANPENCIVIEDSDAGIEAAAAAGMKSMRFYDNAMES